MAHLHKLVKVIPVQYDQKYLYARRRGLFSVEKFSIHPCARRYLRPEIIGRLCDINPCPRRNVTVIIPPYGMLDKIERMHPKAKPVRLWINGRLEKHKGY